MILGVGIDIIEGSRVAAAFEGDDGRDLRDSLFTENEIAYCEAQHTPALHYAARWAAKEALIKAFGDDRVRGFYFKQMEVLNLPSGQPYFNLHGVVKKFAEENKVTHIHLSMAHNHGTELHSAQLAIASVAIESEPV